jgi:hypothetical protein
MWPFCQFFKNFLCSHSKIGKKTENYGRAQIYEKNKTQKKILSFVFLLFNRHNKF